MASSKELSDFLRSVERRAFKQTVYAVRDEQASLDIVQDSMLKLSEKYVDKPANEYPMLFQRILQNTMRDYWRRQKVRNILTSFFSAFGAGKNDDDYDPLETVDIESQSENPMAALENKQLMQIIEQALQKLPTRQRESFILRYWEGMSVAETAKTMGCSQGSVKTHCSRGLKAMVSYLEQQGLDRKALANLGVMS